MSNNQGAKSNVYASGVPIGNFMSFDRLEKPTVGGDSDSPSIIAEKVYPPTLPIDAFPTVEYVGGNNNVDNSRILTVEATLIDSKKIESNDAIRTEHIDDLKWGRDTGISFTRAVKLTSLLSIISMIVATAAILIVLNVGNDGNDSINEDNTLPPVFSPNDSINEDNTLSPTHSPTTTNTDAITNILFENGVISSEDLENVTSPHNKALQWLGSVDERPLDGDDHIIQRYCVALLYYSTSGDDWKNKGNWLQNKHECEWNFFVGNMFAGVKKCNTRMKVTEIDLGYNNLYGVIPSEIGHLKDLEKLFMGSNALYSTIPESIGYLQNLTHLHLDINNLSGTIPTSFGNLESIESLQLNENNLNVSNAEDICTMFSSTMNFLWIDCVDSCSCCEFCFVN